MSATSHVDDGDGLCGRLLGESRIRAGPRPRLRIEEWKYVELSVSLRFTCMYLWHTVRCRAGPSISIAPTKQIKISQQRHE